MRDDRMPRTAVIIDEENDAEEMEVQTSFHESVLIVSHNQPTTNLLRAADAEPWLRIRKGDDLYISCDVTVIPDEDGA